MKIPQLTFTRFIAAIAIVFFHYAQNLFPFTHMTEFMGRWNSAVSYFFILSGFIMITANANKTIVDPKVYYQNRFIRIFPVYLTSIVLILLYIAFSISTLDPSGFVLNLLMIQAWIPEKALSFNHPAWSVSVEVFFYLLFPLLFNKIYTRFSIRKTGLVIISFWLMSQIVIHCIRYSSLYQGYDSSVNYFILFSPLFHLNEFLIGNLLGLFWMTAQHQKKNNAYLLLGITSIYMITMSMNSGAMLNNGLMALLFVPFIYFLSSDNSTISNFFSLPICVYLGEISYGIYILQFPVFLWMHSLLKRLAILDPYINFYTSLLMLIIVAILSYTFIEKPARKYRWG